VVTYGWYKEVSLVTAPPSSIELPHPKINNDMQKAMKCLCFDIDTIFILTTASLRAISCHCTQFASFVSMKTPACIIARHLIDIGFINFSQLKSSPLALTLGSSSSVYVTKGNRFLLQWLNKERTKITPSDEIKEFLSKGFFL
jgi:hypothetical protein